MLGWVITCHDEEAQEMLLWRPDLALWRNVVR